MSDFPERLVFRGVDGQECEDFILAVQERAFSEGKQRDGQWVADFASARFTGDALRWFATLDDDAQDNWKQLRKALLLRYPKVDSGDAPRSAISSTIPTPAAAPPTATESTNGPPSKPTLTGRLKFRSEDGKLEGWIKYNDRFDYCMITDSSSDALRVQYIRDLRRFQAMDNKYRATEWLGDGPFGVNTWNPLRLKSTGGIATSAWGVSSGNSVILLRVGQGGAEKKLDLWVRDFSSIVAVGDVVPPEFRLGGLTLEEM